MHFTNTPTLNSTETMMQKSPCQKQRGGGKNRSLYKYKKEDCDCKYCLYYRKKKGCTVSICPVLDIRLECGAVSFYEVVQITFSEVRNIPFQRRLEKQFKEGDFIFYRNELHKRIFDVEKLKLKEPTGKTLAVLYLLTSDSDLWRATKGYIVRGTIDLSKVQIGSLSPNGYALWKAVKEIQTGKKQISVYELSDSETVSDRAFAFIIQAIMIGRFGSAVLRR